MKPIPTYNGKITLRKLRKSNAVIPSNLMGFASEEPSGSVPPEGRVNKPANGPSSFFSRAFLGTLKSVSSTYDQNPESVSIRRQILRHWVKLLVPSKAGTYQEDDGEVVELGIILVHRHPRVRFLFRRRHLGI